MVKMIAVWGSPNSGKTTTAIQLALALAEKTGRSVLTLFADNITPVLPVIYPTDNTLSSTSFGKILAIAEPTNEDILRFICSDRNSTNCFFLGYGEGENVFSYATASEVSVFNYTGIPFSMIFGFLILSQPIKLTTFIGSVLVIVSGVISFLGEKRSAEKA